MFFGCQMYTAVDKVASQYVKSFYSESEELYTTEKANDLPINVAALVLRSLSLMCQAKDDAVVQSANDSIQMGARLGFFKKGQPSSMAPEELPDNGTRMNAYLAWGAFCWHVTITLFYRQPHVEVINLSPILPIPKNQFFNAVHHKTQEPDDMMGEAFPALCEFWLIVHSALWIYHCSYSDSPPDIWRSILSEHKFRELLAWSNRIPLSLHREKMSGPHVPVCHIWLHAALLDIVRTFTGTESQAPRIWTTFNASDSSADAAYKASVNQLKRLILDYRTNYETSTYSILWHTGLLYLINALLESPRDPEWHLYFLLCIYGYHSLRASYHVSESIGKGLLAMTLRETDLPVDEARKILEHLENGEPADPERRPSATFMADLKLAELDPTRAQVENMAEEFELMALFNEIMEQNRMECSE
ncbi:hypothetical protein NW768_008121 [Fusarium equiseti]|uniref:Uncharacterized protein n=1 Tax=Fusarium equiseti TaxID=61235 RepID=A0ABQ8R5V2_FUSEQ|nr:hypothetical protein NW768_008121 [Fusarium equiseti]